MPRLMILQGGQAIPRDITQPETVLGRLPECDVQLDSNMVSRRHAKLCQQGESYLIEDLGSGNGTFVNGKRIEGQTALKHGDRLKLGPILLRFESASAPSGPDATAADDDLSDFGQFTIDVSGENGTNTTRATSVSTSTASKL